MSDETRVVGDMARIAELIAQVVALEFRVSAYERALDKYPSMNPHQMQARKVCAGVLKLAKEI